MRKSVVIVAAFALVLFSGNTSVRAQEEKVPLDKIPKAVMDASLRSQRQDHMHEGQGG
jgi:hypothetical protein